ncbi:MAG: hypothetical protein SF123_09715 [Chloroflexota bacterium]|nr:hypothetical protein [Chloroflexota bacterium]
MTPNTIDFNAADAVETLDTLLDRAIGYDEFKCDFRAKYSEFRFTPDMRLSMAVAPLAFDGNHVMPGTQPVSSVTDVTDHALGQLYSKLGPVHYGSGSAKTLPSEYLDGFTPEQRADILNWTLKKAEHHTWRRWGEGSVTIRHYRDTTRAILDGNYPRVPNSSLVRMMRDAIADRGNDIGDVKLIRPALDTDALVLKVIWNDLTNGNDDNLRIGVMVRNGETGNSALELLPMVQRWSCENSITVSQKVSRVGVSVTHFPGQSAQSLMVQLYANLPSVMNASADLANRMIEAQQVQLPRFRDVLTGIAIEHGWKNDRLMDDLLDSGREGGRTKAALVNAITYAAHQHPAYDDFQRVTVEQIGGDVLFADQKWFARMERQGELGKKVAV